MGHLGVVLFDVETDQTLQLREAVERMQVQPLMTQRTPECLDHGIAEADLHLGEHTMEQAVGHELVNPWVARLADNLSDRVVVATTASEGLRHGSGSGISPLIAGVSQVRTGVL